MEQRRVPPVVAARLDADAGDLPAASAAVGPDLGQPEAGRQSPSAAAPASFNLFDAQDAQDGARAPSWQPTGRRSAARRPSARQRAVGAVEAGGAGGVDGQPEGAVTRRAQSAEPVGPGSGSAEAVVPAPMTPDLVAPAEPRQDALRDERPGPWAKPPADAPVATEPAARVGSVGPGVRVDPGGSGDPVEPGDRVDDRDGGAVPAQGVLAAAIEDEDEDPPDLLAATEDLRDELAALALPLEVPDVQAARADQENLLTQLDDYVLPRLRRMDAPLLAIVGGSTGAGKSTLVNSLVRREVTRSGVLRPTTRSPVLVHHPYDSGAFLSQRILPGLARVTAEAPEPMSAIDVHAPRVTALRLVPDERLAPGLALIDAPDIDSVVEANRDLAVQLLSACDLWLFVTTASRYADAVPWEMLRQAVDRGVTVAVVLDRVPAVAMSEIRTHLATMLRDRGLATSPMFTIVESPLEDGFLPRASVAPLLGWITRLARDSRSRDVVVRRSLAGVLDSFDVRLVALAAAADEQDRAGAQLRADLDHVYDRTRAEVAHRLCDGTLLRGEVIVRWQEFIGTGDWIRHLETSMGRWRDRFTSAIRSRSVPSEPLSQALRTSVQAMVRSYATQAAEEVIRRWRTQQAGAALLGASGDPSGLGRDFDARLARAVADWQLLVFDLVRAEGQGRRASARVLSLGVNGAGVVLTMAVFGSSADPVEPTDGGPGAAEVARHLLEALFGEQAVRRLAVRARAELVARIEALVSAEQIRLTALVEAAGVRPGIGPSLRTAAQAVEEAR